MLNTQPPQATADLEQRLGRLRNFLSQDPANIGLRSQTIAAAIAVGAWEEAEQLVEAGLSQAPEAAELHAHAGFIALHIHAYEQAKLHFTTAAEQGLLAPAVLYNLAFASFQLGEHQAALTTLDRLASDDSLSTERALLTARCLHYLGERERAVAMLMPIAGHNPEAEGLLALLLHETDKNEEAIAAASRVLSDHPSQLDALLARASALVEQEQYETARQDLATATSSHPHCGRAWSGLAQLDFRDFKFDDALAALQKAVTHMPNHIGTWHLLAWLHILQGRVEEAKAAFETSYELDRNFGETHGGLAVIAVLEDQPRLAEEYIKRAVRLSPNGFAAQYAKMLLLEKQGKTEESKALFNLVMQTTNSGLGIAPEVLVNRRINELAKKGAH